MHPRPSFYYEFPLPCVRVPVDFREACLTLGMNSNLREIAEREVNEHIERVMALYADHQKLAAEDDAAERKLDARREG